jgi:integrase
MDLPMHSDFAEWLISNGQGGLRGIGKAFVFPSLSHSRTGGVQGLSRQFRAIMDRAGIVERIVAADGRKGRCRSSKGFHSLRHTFVSTLANQGVVSELRQRIVGHSDSGVHRRYTHHEFEVLRDAVARLPSIGGPSNPSFGINA